MSAPPAQPKIYHITHVDNLPSLVRCGELWSDARVTAAGGTHAAIGLSEIKRRRLEEIEVACHPGTFVGEYVPFYFCPRSVMLYILHRGNHPELTYRDGQAPIIHLRADLHKAVAWAEAGGVLWAFSTRNAGAFYTDFYRTPRDLGEIDWDAVSATDFRQPEAKERKQVEFLVYDVFPWELVEQVGVHTANIETRVRETLHGVAHAPEVRRQPAWYC